MGRTPADHRRRRRDFLARLAPLAMASTGLASISCRPRVAGLTTVYYHNSHADEAGSVLPELLAEALARSPDRRCPLEELPRRVPEPVLWRIDYRDGLRGRVLVLNGAIGAWSASWRGRDSRVRATGFDTREARLFMHFTYQLKGFEQMIHTGRPSWPVERTVLTSGLLEALLISGHEGGRQVETPHLALAYRSDWSWHPPPPPPPARPLDGP